MHFLPFLIYTHEYISLFRWAFINYMKIFTFWNLFLLHLEMMVTRYLHMKIMVVTAFSWTSSSDHSKNHHQIMLQELPPIGRSRKIEFRFSKKMNTSWQQNIFQTNLMDAQNRCKLQTYSVLNCFWCCLLWLRQFYIYINAVSL